MRGGLSESDNNEMVQDGQSLRSRDDLPQTPSSMMGSQGHAPFNMSQYLVMSPVGQRKETNHSGGAPHGHTSG